VLENFWGYFLLMGMMLLGDEIDINDVGFGGFH